MLVDPRAKNVSMTIHPPSSADYHKYVRAQNKRAETGLMRGARNFSKKGKTLLRGAYRRKKLGRLSMAWDVKVYPRGKKSLQPSIYIHARGGTKHARALEAHGMGATIRPNKSKFLAFPTKNAPKRGWGGKRLSPKTWPKTMPPLQFIKPKTGKLAFLVASDVRIDKRSGRAANLRKQRLGKKKQGPKFPTGAMTVVMFILVPQVRLSQRVNLPKLKELLNKMGPSMMRDEMMKSILE